MSAVESAISKAGHEALLVARGRRSGMTIAIAVHSTVLGPALGGARMWHYESDDEAVADALRLSAAMTQKAAVAGLGLGGGKGVIATPDATPPTGDERRAALLDFGDLVESLAGSYVTAEDVGTGEADMAIIGERTSHVTGRSNGGGGSGDPSPYTAIGVQAAMRAAAHHALATDSLSGLRVAVVGVGHVGERLARGLRDVGAEVLISDIDPNRRALADEIDAEWLEPADAASADCEVLAPCALSGTVNELSLPRLRCRVVCGAANNQLADDDLADELAARGITFAPDFVANSGGLISVYRELRGYGEERALELALGIETTMNGVLSQAARHGETPLAAAHAIANRRIEEARAGSARNGARAA